MKPVGFDGLEVDKNKRLWNAEPGGVHVLVEGQGGLTGPDRKRAFILRNHVNAFIDHHGREHSLFFTTTDSEGLSPREYAKRWHSLMTNESQWIDAFIRVLEPQKNGRPHFHNLTAVTWDTQPDRFDWDAFTAAQDAYRAKDWATFRIQRAKYVQSAAPELRQLWAWSRRVMPLYGLGRAEILPIRKVGAISEYIGKYLDKGMAVKVDSWKGVRRFETDRRTSDQWKRCGRLFSWVSPGAINWRLRVQQLAFAIGCDQQAADVREISRKLGPRWAYRLRGAMITGSDEEWRELLHSLAVQFGVMKSTLEYDNGENAAW